MNAKIPRKFAAAHDNGTLSNCYVFRLFVDNKFNILYHFVRVASDTKLGSHIAYRVIQLISLVWRQKIRSCNFLLILQPTKINSLNATMLQTNKTAMHGFNLWICRKIRKKKIFSARLTHSHIVVTGNHRIIIWFSLKLRLLNTKIGHDRSDYYHEWEAHSASTSSLASISSGRHWAAKHGGGSSSCKSSWLYFHFHLIASGVV